MSTTTLVRDARLAAVAIASLTATSIAGQIATYPNLEPWYAGLQKPPFNPPNWVFAPVWTAIYLLMAFAFWRVLRLPKSKRRSVAVIWFVGLLAVNAAWSWMFFGANSVALGLLNIVPQLAIIVATIIAFRRVDRFAAWCLVPLAAWVAFAAVLNYSLWQLNG
jgi:tryptophan-rich sensory protein